MSSGVPLGRSESPGLRHGGPLPGGSVSHQGPHLPVRTPHPEALSCPGPCVSPRQRGQQESHTCQRREAESRGGGGPGGSEKVGSSPGRGGGDRGKGSASMTVALCPAGQSVSSSPCSRAGSLQDRQTPDGIGIADNPKCRCLELSLLKLRTGVPVVAQLKRIRPGTMRWQVRSLALLSGLRIWPCQEL